MPIQTTMMQMKQMKKQKQMKQMKKQKKRLLKKSNKGLMMKKMMCLRRQSKSLNNNQNLEGLEELGDQLNVHNQWCPTANNMQHQHS